MPELSSAAYTITTLLSPAEPISNVVLVPVLALDLTNTPPQDCELELDDELDSLSLDELDDSELLEVELELEESGAGLKTAATHAYLVLSVAHPTVSLGVSELVL